MATYPVRRAVNVNPWLFAPRPQRGQEIMGVCLHASRGGRTEGDDGQGTENWMGNPNNRGVINGVPQNWGGSCDEIVWENGTRTLVSPDYRKHEPTYGAGFGDAGSFSSGWFYYQIEIAQGRPEDPYTDAEVDSTAQRVGELARIHNFPIQRIPFLHQTGTPPKGIHTHQDSDNGVRLGKSDPGAMFPWEKFLSLAERYRSGGSSTGEEDLIMDAEVAARFDKIERLLGVGTDFHGDGKPENDLPSWINRAHDVERGAIRKIVAEELGKQQASSLSLTPADISAIAKAVADESARRQKE